MVTQIIGDINNITIITEDKTVTWDDVYTVDMETYTDECYNEYSMVITTVNKGYYFRFYTRQDTFKDELCKASPTPKKFKLCYKDSDNKNCIIEGDVEYLNIQDDINTLYDSYIQVFLRDFKVHKDKREKIRQACNLKKEDVEQLEKTLLTNDCILQPLTQSTTATITTGGFMDNSICTAGFMHDSMCTAYDTNLYIQSQDVTIGDKKFKTADLANALDKIVNNDKIASSTTSKKDKTVRWEKAVCKEEFCISDNPHGNITYVNPKTMEPFSIGAIIEKGQAYYRLIGTSLKEFIEWNKENNKEDKSMFNKIFDKYKFGEVKTNNIAYTINGLAFKSADGTYAVYKDGTLINVGDMIIDMPIFVMPTSLKSIEIGDVIVHYGAGSDVFVIVTAIDKDNITVVDPWSKERKNLIPEKSIFGFDFVAKVITPMGMFEKQANADNPFGNMLPFMMMGNGDNKDIMMLMMMSQGNINNQMLPLMFMGKGDNDMLKYMMLTQMSGTTAGIDKE